MTISDETLMAFVDGELDEPAQAAVESAIREEPEVAERVAQHRALRQRVQLAYAAELSEPVPARLIDAARGSAATHETKIINFHDSRVANPSTARGARSPRRWWRPIGSMAASLIIGLGLGYVMWQRAEPLRQGAGGALMAQGKLAQALSGQLAADQSPRASIQIGVSFLAKSGEYCRMFSLAGSAPSSGVACRHGQDWRIQALVQATGGASGASEYRPAGSGLPPVLLQYVEQQIVGDALDRAAEQSALRKGWRADETR
jgi:hypothetical protein